MGHVIAPEMLFAGWRSRLVDAILRALAWLGVVAYVPSFALSLWHGIWSIAVADTLAYGAVIALYLTRRRASLRFRGLALCALFFCLGAALTLVLGPFGAGPLWLLGFAVLSAVLHGSRGLFTSLALGLLPLVAVVWTQNAWVVVVIAVNFVFLACSLVAGIAFMFDEAGRELEARRIAAEELHQAQKLEAIGTLAGGMAHDLNNALQPVLMHARLMQEDLGQGHAAQTDLETIVSSTQRARDLVRRVMTFSRRTKPVRVPVHAAQALREAVAMLRSSIPSSVRIAVDTEGADDAVIRADLGEAHQVFANLVLNGAQAMHDRGGVLGVTLRADETKLTLEVVDTGVGMDEATLARAFEPFFTTKAGGAGTGLGLAVVHGLVRGLNGTITLSSAPGVGTTALVTLPLLRRAAPTQTKNDDPHAPRGRGERVLLVDDEAAVLNATARQLQMLGYIVTSSTSARSALDALRTAPHALDVLLTDLAMPEMSGATLIEEARKLRPELPVVLATGHLDEAESTGESVQRVQKPYSPEEIARALDRALRAARKVEAS